MPSNFADEGILHYRALPLLGLPLGELFVLAPLAEDCARDRALRINGGVGADGFGRRDSDAT
jgi:hypothetical protein